MIRAASPQRSEESPNRLLLAHSARALPRQLTETKYLSVLPEHRGCSLSESRERRFSKPSDGRRPNRFVDKPSGLRYL